MSSEPKRVIVTESSCGACDVHTVQVYHQNFPEMRIEGVSAEQAADHLADRLTAALDNVSNPSHREEVQVAIDDIRAFLDREGDLHPARDLPGVGTR